MYSEHLLVYSRFWCRRGVAAAPGQLMVWSDFRLCLLPRRLMNFESLRNVILCMYM